MSEAEDQDLLGEIQSKVEDVKAEIETLEDVEEDMEEFRSQWEGMDNSSKETFSHILFLKRFKDILG